MISKEKFESDFRRRSGLSRAEYDKHFVTLACVCRSILCQGWANVTNEPQYIEFHNRLYAPRGYEMKLDKAIEILQEHIEWCKEAHEADICSATRLGIEALKAIKAMRHYPFPDEILQLPGETKE